MNYLAYAVWFTFGLIVGSIAALRFAVRKARAFDEYEPVADDSMELRFFHSPQTQPTGRAPGNGENQYFTPAPGVRPVVVAGRTGYSILRDDGAVLFSGDDAGKARRAWEALTSSAQPFGVSFVHNGVVRSHHLASAH